MEFEWDAGKAKANQRKHGMDFADAVSVFSDNLAITVADEGSEEERFITIGMDALGRVAVVIYSWRAERIRIISARKATQHERTQYEGKP